VVDEDAIGDDLDDRDSGLDAGVEKLMFVRVCVEEGRGCEVGRGGDDLM